METGSRADNQFLSAQMVIQGQGRRDGWAGIPAVEDSRSSDYQKQLLRLRAQRVAQIIAAYSPKLRQTVAKCEAVIERFRLLTDRFLEERAHAMTRRGPNFAGM